MEQAMMLPPVILPPIEHVVVRGDRFDYPGHTPGLAVADCPLCAEDGRLSPPHPLTPSAPAP